MKRQLSKKITIRRQELVHGLALAILILLSWA